MASNGFAQAKIRREVLQKSQIDFPEYTVNEIFKIGYTTLKSLNKANEIIYGKQRVRKARGMV